MIGPPDWALTLNARCHDDDDHDDDGDDDGDDDHDDDTCFDIKS